MYSIRYRSNKDDCEYFLRIESDGPGTFRAYFDNDNYSQYYSRAMALEVFNGVFKKQCMRQASIYIASLSGSYEVVRSRKTET